MSRIMRRLVRGAELRAAPGPVYGQPATLQAFPLFGARTASGRVVTPDTSLELVRVYSVVQLIASAIGGLPLKVYRRQADGNRIEARGRQWSLLHDAPNGETSADEFWESVTMCLLLWGNAFLYKERDTAGVVQALWAIRPDRVGVGREDTPQGSVRFFQVSGVRQPLYETDILHIRGLSPDGLVGYSPVQLARQQLANQMEQDQFRGAFWKNGMFAGGVLKHPNRLGKEAQDRLKLQIEQRSGSLHTGEVMVLEEGMELSNLTMPLADAQFLEQSGYSDLEIAQLFGLVPPHRWGASGGSKESITYQNSEFGGQEFVKWTGRRWMIRIEKSLGRDKALFPPPGPQLYAEFDVDALLRADTASRWNTYKIGLDAGFINLEYVQQAENIPPEFMGEPKPEPVPLAPGAQNGSAPVPAAAAGADE